jgi:ABC-type branched-subunit amino acid transport system ATPase component
MSLLEVSGLKASYGVVPALHNVDFHAEAGEVVGILGHNGMGKTTLLRAIMGFVKVTDGAITSTARTSAPSRSISAPAPASAWCPRGGRSSPTSRSRRT